MECTQRKLQQDRGLDSQLTDCDQKSEIGTVGTTESLEIYWHFYVVGVNPHLVKWNISSAQNIFYQIISKPSKIGDQLLTDNKR